MAKNEETRIVKHEPSRTNTLLAGALIGAGAGAVAAILLHRKAAKNQRESTLNIAEGIKVGLLVFGLLRAIAALGDDDN